MFCVCEENRDVVFVRDCLSARGVGDSCESKRARVCMTRLEKRYNQSYLKGEDTL